MSVMRSRVFGQIAPKLAHIGSRFQAGLLHGAVLLVLGAGACAWAVTPLQVTQWRSGLIELDQAWVEHDGDDLRWAARDFDDRQWY